MVPINDTRRSLCLSFFLSFLTHVHESLRSSTYWARLVAPLFFPRLLLSGEGRGGGGKSRCCGADKSKSLRVTAPKPRAQAKKREAYPKRATDPLLSLSAPCQILATPPKLTLRSTAFDAYFIFYLIRKRERNDEKEQAIVRL